MTTYTFLPNSISNDDMEYFKKVNRSRGLVPSGDSLRIVVGDCITDLVIFKHRNGFPPYGTVMEWGKDRLLYAAYSRYILISKTGEIINNDY